MNNIRDGVVGYSRVNELIKIIGVSWAYFEKVEKKLYSSHRKPSFLSRYLEKISLWRVRL